MSFTFKDNSEQVLSEVERRVLAALEAVGLDAEGNAQALAPYDTGLLRNSITHAIDGEAPKKKTYRADTGGETGTYKGSADKESNGKRCVYIGTNVEYAPYQELGTSKTAAQPFLKPAVANNADRYKSILKDVLKGK